MAPRLSSMLPFYAALLLPAIVPAAASDAPRVTITADELTVRASFLRRSSSPSRTGSCR